MMLKRLSRLIWLRLRQALCGLFLLQMMPQCFADDLNVLLILSGNAVPYQKFATAFRHRLPPAVHVRQLEHVQAFPAVEQQTDLIVTVGLKAGNWAATHTSKPVLAAMLPSQQYAVLKAEHRPAHSFSAIFVDQPWSRQVHLLHIALPNMVRVGLLHSPQDDLDTKQLRHLLAKYGASLIERTTSPVATLFDSLNDVLSQSDVLLAVPDSAIYNSSNIRDILLSSYRQGIPLVGLSQAYVDAGALCAVFSSPENLADQASAETISYARTRRLPEAQFPKFYSVAVNREVAIMLGIRIKPAEWIKSQIEQAEK